MSTARRTLQFGNTEFHVIEGEPLEYLSEAVYVAVNARAVLASGLAGAIRLAAGAEVERELRLHGDLLLGTAYMTGAGRLESCGVRRIVHGVTVPEPGASPRRVAVEQAFTSALSLLDGKRTRAVTIPEIGTRILNLSFAHAAGILTARLIAALRRGNALEQVTIVGLHLEYLRAVRDGLIQEGASLG